jgi:hypothetical protein
VSGEEAPTHVSIVAGPLVGPVLRRVVGMFAARADLPLDRLDDAVLVADMVAAQAAGHVLDDTVQVTLASSVRSLDMRVGPLRAGGGSELVRQAAVPGVGNVIEQLADYVEVETDGEHEFLVVRLAYAGSD